MRLKKIKEAVETLTVICKYSDSNGKAFYLRAKSLFMLKNYSAALTDLVKAKSLCNSAYPELDQYISDLKKQINKEKDNETK